MKDVWRFADALAFNWLIVGTDAHAKNSGLLLAGTQIRLAPLYDIASYLPHDDSDGYKVKLAMKIGDDKLRRTDRRSAWDPAADELKPDAERLVERVLDVARRMPDAFALAAERSNVAGPETDLPQRLVELVADRCRRCVAVLS